jgi:Co/Zn/Cd efflux system component
MDACCSNESDVLRRLQERQKTTLVVVLVINAVMFVVELVSGLMAGSVALVADSLDMLGDALVYGFSLYVVGRSAVWKARAAISKATVMGLFGAFVLAQLVYKLVYPAVPAFQTMGFVGVAVLVANSVCFALLWSHRAEDINMRSVWLCSRNDLIANTSVLFAAWAVWATASPWPDVAVGALICSVFLRSAFVVAREAREQLRPTPVHG